MDQVIADDLIVQGSIAVGFDAVDGESFGFDTVRLKENNTRLAFDDTSATAGFPANDWCIVANDANSGGASYLAFQDVTADKVPFKVMAGARDNALYVSNTGRIGVGTAAPVLNVHLLSDNTPAIRLEQTADSGFTPQTWDVAGNEANFFVRDLTGGARLPFRIRPGAPTSSIDIAGSGRIGMGTASPLGKLDVRLTSGTALLVTDDGKVGIGTNNPQAVLHVKSTNDTDVLVCENSGNVIINRVLSQTCDVNQKENFSSVDGRSMLEAIDGMPVSIWNYKDDARTNRHVGPTAQDFHAALKLNPDDKHIAPMDLAGAAVAGVKGLNEIRKDQARQIETLRHQNEDLQQRLAALEQRLSALEK